MFQMISLKRFGAVQKKKEKMQERVLIFHDAVAYDCTRFTLVFT